MRWANAEPVYHERQCWYSDYTIFGCQREVRLHTLADSGASGARTDCPMAFKLHTSPTDPLMWCVTGFHTYSLTLRSLLGTIPLFSQWAHCRTTTQRKNIYKFYWISAYRWRTIACVSSIQVLKYSMMSIDGKKTSFWNYKIFYIVHIGSFGPPCWQLMMAVKECKNSGSFPSLQYLGLYLCIDLN